MSTPSAPARLDLLLRWVNGACDEYVYGPGDRPEDGDIRVDYAAIRKTLAAFVASFDGCAAAGYVEVIDPERGMPAHIRQPKAPATDDELDMLGVWLRLAFKQGFGGDATLAHSSFPASLRLAVRSAGRQDPGWRNSVKGNRVRAGGATALRDYRAAGAYVLQVGGSTVDVVMFCAAHLLTAPDMVAVRQCERKDCDRFLVTATAARGARRKFCSDPCRLHNQADIAETRQSTPPKKTRSRS